MTNFSLEELVIREIEVRGLESDARLEFSISTQSLSNSESNPVRNVLTFLPNEKKEVNLLLFSQDRCQIKIGLKKDIVRILEKFSNKTLKCEVLKKEYDSIVLASRISKKKQEQMTAEELEKSLSKQAESLEKKYTLEEKIRRCSAKTTLGKFRRRRKARLVFHLNNNRSFEVNIRSRNLVGELKILPKEPVVNVLFPGPNRYFKFEVLNTFGKMLKILKVKNKPMKIGLFEAYSSKKFIASSPKPGKVNKSNFSRLT